MVFDITTILIIKANIITQIPHGMSAMRYLLIVYSML